jgi:hypothetical protein
VQEPPRDCLFVHGARGRRLRESWPFRHIEKRVIFLADFGLRFFYTNPSQILESLTDFHVDFFLHRCSQIQIFTHLWNIYTGVDVTQHNDTIDTIEGSPAISKGGGNVDRLKSKGVLST